MKKRILIFEFHQETNTFNPVSTPLERFDTGLGFEGETVFQNRMERSCPIHGAVDAITAAGGEVIPTVFLYATSGGRAEDSVLEFVCRRIAEYAEKEPFDAIFAYSDLLAMEAAWVLDQLGLSERSIGLVGFDDIQSRIPMPIRVKSVKSFKALMSHTAYELLIEKIDDPNAANKQIVISTEISAGETA